MGIRNKFINCFKTILDEDFRFLYFSGKGFYKKMPDRKYLERFYKAHMNQPIDLDNPKTFNEKIQWLKLNDRKPEYVQMVDKIGAKEYVSERLGKEYIIPTLGVWDSFDDIDFDKLPNQFVLKCAHGSGDLVICQDKSKLDVKAVRKKMTAYLKREYYYYGREWPYKNVKPRIFAEQYMCDSESDQGNLTDYKIFCFDGVPKFVMTVRDRSKGKGNAMHRFYDTEWNIQDLDLDYRNEKKISEPKPENLDKLLEIAAMLSKGIKHLRVDLYIINGQIYFGEMTFYHMSGVETFVPEKWDAKLGEYLNIP
jgi:hypothetical protein